GAPAGVALGLNMVFGSAAHCFFVEPRECPCVLLAMQHPDGPPPSIYDAGLTGMPAADGLAVPRASQCAVDSALPLVSGVLLPDDKTMQEHTRLAYEAHSLRLEPSAAAGFAGPECLAKSTAMAEYIAKNDLSEKMGNGAHVVWATGGRFMPDAEFFAFLDRKFDTQ